MLNCLVTPENEKCLGWLGSSVASPQMFFRGNLIYLQSRAGNKQIMALQENLWVDLIQGNGI
uniref:Uncharacterized protein n=1 Tax=Candidatus Kentrum sp. FW TaxID=2126338 RepID=A0A450SJ86_9GAMM|nr:MAG: hypothetical protein BECKFW1821A_GA0114235_10431 [Candidatus Kentron sp. FW]